MSDRLTALALKKQRLQIKCGSLREQWIGQAQGAKSVCDLTDRIVGGWTWLRRHPEIVVAVVVALVVARRSVVFRWLRRGFLAWQVWRRGRGWLLGRLLS
jgi:hypothetical protein